MAMKHLTDFTFTILVLRTEQGALLAPSLFARLTT